MVPEKETLYVFPDEPMTIKQAMEELESNGEDSVDCIEITVYRPVTLKRRVEFDVVERTEEKKA